MTVANRIVYIKLTASLITVTIDVSVGVCVDAKDVVFWSPGRSF